MKAKLIKFYIAKNFLIKFFQIFCGFSLLIFFINLLDSLEKVKETNGPSYVAMLMAFFQIPSFLNDVIPSLILISAIITFFLLSSKSEITIIRMSGFSLWELLQPVAISGFILGIFWITIFGEISIKMDKKFNALESKYVKNEMREVMTVQNGIWLKQENMEKPGEEIAIQAKRIYRENLEFKDVTVWFFNQYDEFYKKIDAQEMLLQQGSWVLKDIIINDAQNLNKKIATITIPTNLETDFIMQKVVTNFQNAKLFSLFELPKLSKDLRSSGFNPTKFDAYFHSLISKPFLFLAMTLIACYFGLNHIRDNNSILMIFIGIIIGLALYITSSIVNALGASGIIPIFASTWVITIICLAVGTLLIYQKENL